MIIYVYVPSDVLCNDYCMCSTSGVNWVSRRALVFVFVWWGVMVLGFEAGFGIRICVVGCYGFPIYLSCWFGAVLGKII